MHANGRESNGEQWGGSGPIRVHWRQFAVDHLNSYASMFPQDPGFLFWGAMSTAAVGLI